MKTTVIPTESRNLYGDITVVGKCELMKEPYMYSTEKSNLLGESKLFYIKLF